MPDEVVQTPPVPGDHADRIHPPVSKCQQHTVPPCTRYRALVGGAREQRCIIATCAVPRCNYLAVAVLPRAGAFKRQPSHSERRNLLAAVVDQQSVPSCVHVKALDLQRVRSHCMEISAVAPTITSIPGLNSCNRAEGLVPAGSLGPATATVHP